MSAVSSKAGTRKEGWFVARMGFIRNFSRTEMFDRLALGWEIVRQLAVPIILRVEKNGFL